MHWKVFDELLPDAARPVSSVRSMELTNLTPHTINVHRADGSVLEIPPYGQVARVEQRRVLASVFGEIEFYITEFGDIEGLPDPVTGPDAIDTMFIVSEMVRAALGAGVRPDVVTVGAPVCDADGKVIGCKGFTI